MASFPSQPENLTTEFLSETIGSNVSSFEIEQIGIGVGLLGRLYRLTLTSDGGPAAVIAKFPTLDEGARMHVVEPLRFYEKEVRYYSDFADTSAIPTAHSYFAEHDPATGDFLLILEDFGDRRMEDQIAGCPAHDAHAAIDALIQLHSQWWDSDDFPAWLPSYSDPPYPQVIAGMYKQSWPAALAVFGDHLSPKYMEYGERYADLVPYFMEGLTGEPLSLCHGDYRLDNLFFGTKPEHPSLSVVDWQICFRGRPAYDVAYFVSQSLETEARRGCEASLQKRYLEGLAAAGSNYDETQFMEDYKRTVAYCFIYAVVSAGQIEMANERQRELVIGIADRAVQAMEDIDALAVLPS
ncbi:MAG: phosphotransferase [Actinomycetota bacterium]